MASRQDRPSVIMGFPKSSHRYSAASGLVFVVLVIISILLFGLDVPTYDDPGRVFANYYADHNDSIELSVWIGGLASVAFIWFAGFLRWVYSGAETAARGFVRATDIGYASAIAGVAVATLTGAAQMGAVVANGTVDPAVIRALDLFGDYAFALAGQFIGIWLITSFFMIRVTKVMPQWLGFLAVLGTACAFIQSVIVLAPQNDDGPLGAFAYAFGIVLFIWVAGASITLIRRVDAIQFGR